MTEWMTYAEIGERFGLKPEAARTRVRRLGWRTQPGNDGRTVVQVPDDVDWRPGGERSNRPGGEHPVDRAETGHLTALLAASEARAERAERQADDANRRADSAMAVADRLAGRLADEAARMGRAELLADQAHAEAEKARRQVALMEARDAARKAKPRWRRLWDGWRGV